MGWKIDKALMAIVVALVLTLELPLFVMAEDPLTDGPVQVVQESQPEAAPSEPAQSEPAVVAPSEPVQPVVQAPAPAEQAEAESKAAEQVESEAKSAEQTEPETKPAEGEKEILTGTDNENDPEKESEAPKTQETTEENKEETDDLTGSEIPEGSDADPANPNNGNGNQGSTDEYDVVSDDEMVIVRGDTPYSADAIMAGDLTTTIKGLSDAQYEEILRNFAREIPAALNTDQAYKLIVDSVVDAEKFSTAIEDYDSQLCWAATASNMLWTSGYAQAAVNPMTGEKFASEDEVFNYFRNNFTDVAGVPDGAIEYFFEGYYKYQGMNNVSQLVDDSYPGELLPDENLTENTVDQRSTANILETLNDLSDGSAGAWLRWWDTSQNKYRNGAHWLTLAGITTDNTKTDEEFTEKYKGIILADSDNDPYDDDGTADESMDSWPSLAENQPNSYTFYELSWEDIGGSGAWVVLNYTSNLTIKAVLGAVYWIADRIVPTPAPSPAPSGGDDGQHDESSAESSAEEIIEVPVEQNIDEIKAQMEANGQVVYSPTNSMYNQDSNDECVFYVRNISTSLLNVYLDGQRLSENQINFRIEILPNGLFKIVLSRDLMKSLKKGKHELLLDFYNISSINVIIEVE